MPIIDICFEKVRPRDDSNDISCFVKTGFSLIDNFLTLFWTGSGITLLDGGGPLWPGWILAILRLSVGILKPKNDFHQNILIFGCP